MAVMSDNIRTDSNEEIERLGLTAALKYYMDTYDKQKAANESLLAECRKLEHRIEELEGLLAATKALAKEVDSWAEDAGGYAPAWFDVEDALKALDADD